MVCMAFYFITLGEPFIWWQHKKTSDNRSNSESDDSETESDKGQTIYIIKTTKTYLLKKRTHTTFTIGQPAEIQKSHRVRPLSAYSKSKKNKINPHKYRDKLRGAIIEIQFTISHIKVGQKDVFEADIVNINVLQPPQNPFKPRKTTKTYHWRRNT